MLNKNLRPKTALSACLAMCTIAVAACAPSTSPGGSSGSTSIGQSQAPKTVIIGIQREPHSLHQNITGGGSLTAGGASNVPKILNDNLSVASGGGEYEARLAVEMPAVDKGTWRTNPDGTMDMTWKLQPNAKWHDGTAFTSSDMLFTFQVRQEIGTRTAGGGRPELMESATAPDPHTFVVHWGQIYVRAGDATGLEPLPRHLLEPLFQQDKEAFAASRYFTTEFVGLGPYRLTRWEQGSHIEAVRFDDYYLGRPPIDRVIVQFVPDPNTLVANILAEAIDVVISDAVDVSTALEVRQRWEGTGNRVQFHDLEGLHQLEMQHRPDLARPRNGFTVRAVRQGLYSAIDRQSLTEVVTGGVAPTADSWYAPSHPQRRALEPNIPQFPYDLARARQLLATAGWQPGADGILVHAETGDRFETAIMTKRGTGAERALATIADGWKQVGVQAEFDILTVANQDDREYQSKRPGPYFTSPSGVNFYDNRLNSDAITRPENRWTGTNRGGYLNPAVDTLLNKLAVTIDDRERLALHRDLLREQMEDIALMPLLWEVQPLLVRKGLVGPRMTGNEGTTYIYQWEKQ